MMLPGKSYPFHLTFSNPLYDPITVRLSVQRSLPGPTTPSAIPETPSTPTASQAQSMSKRPPYAISLPTTSFLVNPFAEAWEYEDDEDEEMFDEEELGLNLGISRTSGRGGTGRDGAVKGKVKTVGVLERRANVTKIGGEVVVSKEGKGNVKVRCAQSTRFGWTNERLSSSTCLFHTPTVQMMQDLMKGKTTQVPQLVSLPVPRKNWQQERRIPKPFLSTQWWTSVRSHRRKW